MSDSKGAADSKEEESMFRDIGHAADAVEGADADGGGGEEGERDMHGDVTSVESLCMACRKNGMTNIMLTRIPYFRDVIIMSFECDHCGHRSTSVQNAEVAERGCKYTLKVKTMEDRNRQVVRSPLSSVFIPELEFEMPPMSDQQGVFTTVEGLLTSAVEDLRATQNSRSDEVKAQVEAFVTQLAMCAAGLRPYTLILDDPTGNSYLENPNAPSADPQLRVENYTRTREQNEKCGLAAANARDEGETGRVMRRDAAGAGGEPKAARDAGATSGRKQYRDLSGPGNVSGVAAAEAYAGRGERRDGDTGSGLGKAGSMFTHDDTKVGSKPAGDDGRLFFESSASSTAKEVMRFPVDCFNCSAAGETLMCTTDIPFFKEVIIMSFNCDECGWRNVEVKGGGATPDTGRIMKLHVTPGEFAAEDMRRDCIKSDTAMLLIPELELELEHGSLGGIYTTVEGMLTKVKERLIEANPFQYAALDSAAPVPKDRFRQFVADIDAMSRGEKEFTLVLEDPMSNSWIHSPYAPEPDPRLEVKDYTRTEEENIRLGLHDMRTELDTKTGTYSRPAHAGGADSGAGSGRETAEWGGATGKAPETAAGTSSSGGGDGHSGGVATPARDAGSPTASSGSAEDTEAVKDASDSATSGLSTAVLIGAAVVVVALGVAFALSRRR